MKIKLLYITFFLGSLLVNAQNEYGILVKTTLNPRVAGYTTRYTIEARNNDGPRFTTANIQPTNQTLVQYNFFYINTTPINELYYLAVQLDGNNQKRCGDEYTIPFDKATFLERNLTSCLGISNVYPIELTQPADNTVCAEKTIALNEGWNYEYKYDAGAWTALPSQYQDKTNIFFKLKDIGGYEGKSQVFFRAGYKTQFTNTIVYKIIGCSPVLDGPLIPADVTCKYKTDGSVTLNFKTELSDGKEFLFNIFLNRATPQFIKHVVVLKNQMVNNTSYTWENLGAENYIIKYQSQDITDPTTRIGDSVVPTDSFTIGSPTALTFTATEIQPECNAGNGAITISASGGSPPYFYMLDDETFDKRHPFTSPDTIYNIGEGKHKIKVIDSNECIEKAI